MKDKNLENRLLYLPINILSRVELWLTYKDIKQASTISLHQDFIPEEKRTKRIVKWFKDTGIYYALDKDSKDLLHISKTQALANKMSELQWSDKPEDIIFRGEKYGFPTEAVKQFAKNIKSMSTNLNNDIPFWEYARYRVRKGYEKEDMKIAAKWGNTIRRDIPKLATWFEKEMQKATLR